MTRTRLALAAGVTAVAVAVPAAAQQSPTPGSTTAPATTTTPSTTSPGTTGTTPATAPTAPPVLRNLKLARTIRVRQGHARFLVGVRLSAAAKVTITVTAVKGDQLVRTVTSSAIEKPGRVYVLVEATNEQRYQLPDGRYTVRVTAADAAGKVSKPVQRIVTLALTPPRGRLDLDLAPLWRPMARSLGVPAQGGQLVSVVAPRGDAAKSGIRRGDVITSVNGMPTITTGQLQTALRALPAKSAVPVELRRQGAPQTVQLTVQPDWVAVPDLTRPLTAVLRRNPKVMAYAVAAALYQVERGQPDAAQALVDEWPAAWRRSAPGQYVQGKILERRRLPKQALGAYNRALARDPRMSDAALARGLALNELGNDAAAADAFAKARALDPKDASAAAFQAFSLIRASQPAPSLEPGRAAAQIDADYADAKVAEGIALITNRARARGVVALREGLVLTDDPARAQQIIDQYLEPNDP